jgi:copper transporter 1
MDAARDASSSHSATGAEKQAATLSQPHAVLHASSDSIEPRKPSPSIPPRLPRLRAVPPFIAGHDIPRGILYAFQMFIGYLLMLAVM